MQGLIGDQKRKLATRKALASQKKPGRLINRPANNGVIYGVGNCTPRYHPEIGWQAVEKDARINLAVNLKAKIRHLGKYATDYNEQILSTETAVRLKTIAVVARWYDVEDGSYHVLVGVADQQPPNEILDFRANSLKVSLGSRISGGLRSYLGKILMF